MKVLITGAAGLIGGHLSKVFHQEGHDVIATFRDTVPSESQLSSGIKFVNLDIADGLQSILDVDVIIHAAALTHLIPDATASDYIHSNLTGAIRVAEYAESVKPKVLVYMSTLSVYGNIQVSELLEETPLGSPEMYGLTKYMGELIFKNYASAFPSVCIRLPGVVGEGYFTPWLGKILRTANNDNPITIYNPDSMFNNVVDLTELQSLVSRIMAMSLTGFEVVNFAASEPISIREVVELIIKKTGSGSSVSEEQSTRNSFTINTDKVRRLYEFCPSTTNEIIQRYITDNFAESVVRKV